MNPKKSSIIALSLVAVASFIVWLNHTVDEDSLPMAAGDEMSTAGDLKGKREGSPTASREESVREVKQQQLALWWQNASAGLARSKKNLVSDLSLSPEEAAQVEKIFARREAELAGLLARMHSGEAADDMEHFRKICSLLRNKGLREDLAAAISPQKLATFDAHEAERERETVEARAYRDMAAINDVVLLTDSQKQQALAALIRSAPARVEHEADARAFMTLNYGQMLSDVDSAGIRGLANMVSTALNHQMPDVEIDSSRYQQWTQANKKERIERDLSTLRGILDEQQLARYREHLEAEPAW